MRQMPRGSSSRCHLQLQLPLGIKTAMFVCLASQHLLALHVQHQAADSAVRC